MSTSAIKSKIPVEFMKKARNLLKLIEESAVNIGELSLDERICICFTVLEKPSEYRNNLDLKLLSHCTEDIKYFKDLRQTKNGEFIHEMFCKYMQCQYFEKDQIVFEEGENGSQFYLVLQGEVKITKKLRYVNEEEKVITIDDEKIRLKLGQCFGELALINNKPRAATVKTTMPCYFAVLDREYYNNILNNVSNKFAFMDKFAQMKIFKGWDNNITLKNLYDLSNEIKLTYGNHVYCEGDESDFLYLIKQGDFQIRKKILISSTYNNNDGCEQKRKNDLEILQRNTKPVCKTLILNLLQEKEYFGEEEIITENKFQSEIRTFSVVCMSSQGILYSINKLDFQKKIFLDDTLYNNLRKSIKQKQIFRDSQIQNLSKEDIQPQFLAQQAKNLIQKKVLKFNLYDEINDKNDDNHNEKKAEKHCEEKFNSHNNNEKCVEIIECFDVEKKKYISKRPSEQVIIEKRMIKKPCANIPCANYLKFETDVLNVFLKKFNFPQNLQIVTRKQKYLNSLEFEASNQQNSQQQQQQNLLTERLPGRFLQKSNQKLNLVKMQKQYQKAVENYKLEVQESESLNKSLIPSKQNNDQPVNGQSQNNNSFINIQIMSQIPIQTIRNDFNSQSAKNLFYNNSQQQQQQQMITPFNQSHTENYYNTNSWFKENYDSKIKIQQLNKFQKNYLSTLQNENQYQKQTQQKKLSGNFHTNEQSLSNYDTSNENLQTIHSFTSRSNYSNKERKNKAQMQNRNVNVNNNNKNINNLSSQFQQQRTASQLNNIYFDIERQQNIKNSTTTQGINLQKNEDLPLKYQTEFLIKKKQKKYNCLSFFQQNIKKLSNPSLDNQLVGTSQIIKIQQE